MSFSPYPTRSSLILLALALISGAAATWLVTAMPQPGSLSRLFFLLLGLLATLALLITALYGATIALRLHYHLNRNGLVIQWGLTQQLIPFDSIKKIVPGQNLPPLLHSRVLNLAGLRFGWGELAEYGPLKIYATTPPDHSLLVVTPEQSYLISPQAPESFLKAWQARQELGPTQHWPLGARRHWPLNLPLLMDPLLFWLLGLAALLCLALFGYLALSFASLPDSVAIHFNALGQADRIVNKSGLLVLPAGGVLVLAFNALLGSLLYHREKMAAYLLWGTAVVMQVCLWAAMLTLTA